MKKENVQFRLEPEFLKLLNEAAAEQGKSKGIWAKRLVIQALTDTERTEIRLELEKVQKDLRKLRGDLATLSAHLFEKVAKMKPAEAEALVREILAP